MNKIFRKKLYILITNIQFNLKHHQHPILIEILTSVCLCVTLLVINKQNNDVILKVMLKRYFFGVYLSFILAFRTTQVSFPKFIILQLKTSWILWLTVFVKKTCILWFRLTTILRKNVFSNCDN